MKPKEEEEEQTQNENEFEHGTPTRTLEALTYREIAEKKHYAKR